MKKITNRSLLYIENIGYVGVAGWSFTPRSNADDPSCVIFTPENLGPMRMDNFHVNLLNELRKSYEDRILSWRPLTKIIPVAESEESLRVLVSQRGDDWVIKQLSIIARGHGKIQTSDKLSEAYTKSLYEEPLQSTLVEKEYLFSAVAGHREIQKWVVGGDQKSAKTKFWDGLTDGQRNSTASVECIDERALSADSLPEENKPSGGLCR
jgi:hypothetical protein